MNFWDAFSVEYHQGLEKLSTMMTVQPGESLFIEGDTFTGFYVVKSGRLRIFNINDSGEQATISIAEPGSAISAVPVLMTISNYHANCEALTVSEVFFFPLQPFLSHLMSSSKFTLEFARMGVSHTLVIRDKYLSLALNTAKQRFLGFLEQNGAGKQFIKLPASKKVIASLLDISAETLSRLIRQLESENLIAVDSDRFRIL